VRIEEKPHDDEAIDSNEGGGDIARVILSGSGAEPVVKQRLPT